MADGLASKPSLSKGWSAFEGGGRERESVCVCESVSEWRRPFTIHLLYFIWISVAVTKDYQTEPRKRQNSLLIAVGLLPL